MKSPKSLRGQSRYAAEQDAANAIQKLQESLLLSVEQLQIDLVPNLIGSPTSKYGVHVCADPSNREDIKLRAYDATYKLCGYLTITWSVDWRILLKKATRDRCNAVHSVQSNLVEGHQSNRFSFDCEQVESLVSLVQLEAEAQEMSLDILARVVFSQNNVLMRQNNKGAFISELHHCLLEHDLLLVDEVHCMNGLSLQSIRTQRMVEFDFRLQAGAYIRGVYPSLMAAWRACSIFS